MKYGHKKKCPRVSKNLVVGVKQRADAGDTSPFSPMPLQISAIQPGYVQLAMFNRFHCTDFFCQFQHTFLLFGAPFSLLQTI